MSLGAHTTVSFDAEGRRSDEPSFPPEASGPWRDSLEFCKPEGVRLLTDDDKDIEGTVFAGTLAWRGFYLHVEHGPHGELCLLALRQHKGKLLAALAMTVTGDVEEACVAWLRGAFFARASRALCDAFGFDAVALLKIDYPDAAPPPAEDV